MSSPDVSPSPAQPVPTPAPGFAGHLGRIALLSATLLAGSFVGALVAALVGRSASPLSVALARADDVSEPLMVVAALAAAFAGLRALLGEGMARRRRLVALRRTVRKRGWLVHLLWLPVILVVVFAEGSVLLIALATPIIVIGLTWIGARLSAAALTAGPATYAAVAIVGLAFGLFA